MKYLTMCLFLGISILSVNSHAETVRGNIYLLGVVEAENYATVYLKDVDLELEESNHPCGVGKAMSVNLESESGRATYSMLLASYMADKKIRIDFSSQECGLWGSQPIINRVYFGA